MCKFPSPAGNMENSFPLYNNITAVKKYEKDSTQRKNTDI
jgi:hypothetical protein